MKTKLLFVLVLFTRICHGQYTAEETEVVYIPNENTNKHTVGAEIDIFRLHLNYEYNIYQDITLYNQIGIIPLNDGLATYTFYTLSTEARWYYNMNPRKQIGKNTARNAANFFSGKAMYYIAPENFISMIVITGNFGIVRNIGRKGFYWGTGIGVGTRKNNRADRWNSTFDMSCKIGWRFGF